MKSIPKFAFTMLTATLLLAALPTEMEAMIYDDTVRLHILANSDSQSDQELKLEVRDLLLNEYGEILKKTESKSEAEDTIKALLEDMSTRAEEFVRDAGYKYSVKATLSREWYDTREYEGFSLPAGYYTSLRVIIGNGNGQKWWCVMYPPMCMGLACEESPADDGIIDYTSEEIHLIKSGKYNIKFKILEELSRAFAKSG